MAVKPDQNYAQIFSRVVRFISSMESLIEGYSHKTVNMYD